MNRRRSHCSGRCLLTLVMVFLQAVAFTVTGLAAGRDSALEKGFRQPPESARPWVYWFIMDGNLTREGITADFEALKKAGIGGVIMMEVDVGIPRGPVKFMSPEWRALFKHAVGEAERLGLQITLNAGPGWTGSGGPWVKPEQSMQHLVASAVEVEGPKHFDEALPRPQRRPAFFGDGALPPELEKAKNDFYRDVLVLAFPAPTGNERVKDIDEKALYVRAPYSSQPGVKARLPSLASYPSLPAEAVVAADRVVDLTTKLDAAGRLDWDVPEGKWTLMRFGRTSNGAGTRPAPYPGLGLECDKLDKAALDAHFDAFIGALLREIGPRKKAPGTGWTMLHIDSWEMGAQNWTAAFREEFRRRRGYDPVRYLPAITGRLVDSLEVTERFLWDWRQTCQELVIENHAEHLKALGHQHGFGLSIEPYDMMPCADMSIGAAADVPMGEFWLYGFDTAYSVIEASSIGHTCGKPIVAAESFTSTDAERWQAYPASMKALGDWAFCSGVNRIVVHRSQHQPWLDRRPGMTMGPYGVHWERTQTFWDMVDAYHQYLARCQLMLRQGLPVADVCFLVPEGSPQVFRPPASATRGNPPERLGYNFDGCAPETLLARMSVKKGRLVLPDGMSYRVLVLPELPTMTPRLLRKVKELVQTGATVIGPPPVKSPSLSGYPGCDAEVRKLVEELWNSGGKAGGRDGKNGSNGKKRQVIWDAAFKTSEVAGETQNQLKQATWIWYNEGNPAISAPVGKRFFLRSFVLPEVGNVESARAFVTADNSFELWVNGRKAGAGDNFHVAPTMEVKLMLRAGTNLLAVAAENGGDAPNPAGLIGMLVVKYRDGHTLTVPTDKAWQASQTVRSRWMRGAAGTGDWSAALEMGPMGMGPWGTVELGTAEPEVYCDFSIVTGLLGKLGVPPDFEADGPLRYTHRRDGQADIYFIANREDRPIAASCTFRASGKAPELWDPLTGETRTLPDFVDREGRSTVPLRFEAAQSFFVVFRKESSKSAGENFPKSARLAELSGPWEVAFDPKWGGPGSVTFDALVDWTKRSEDGIRFYSGTAVYRKVFDAPEVTRGQRLYLDLGVVKNLAQVRLNGHDLGVVWCAPWRVEVTGRLKTKDNQLEITVANLWPNRLIGDQSLPAAQRLTYTTWNPFTKATPLLESGLLGPITLGLEEQGNGAKPKRAQLPSTDVRADADIVIQDAAHHLVTMADGVSNLVLRLNYDGRCLLDRVSVRGREVIAPATGVCSAIQVSNDWFTTRSNIPAPRVAVARNQVTVSGILYGGAGVQVDETWTFVVRADRIDWQIDRRYLSGGRLDDACFPGWDFQDMTSWTGGMVDDGGVAWNKYLETKNATYGAHAGAVTFWNRERGDCLRIRNLSLLASTLRSAATEDGSAATPSRVGEPQSGGGPNVALRFSHEPSGIETVAFSVTESELKPKHDLCRYLASRQDLWAPVEVAPGHVSVQYSLEALDYDAGYDRGTFRGLNGRSMRELLNTIGRYGVIDRRIVGSNGWRTGFACPQEQWFSQMGIALDDPDYLANCAAAYDFERDHAIESSGRVKSRWCYNAGDAIPGTYDAYGFYEAQWGYMLDSQPCYVICVAELFDQTGNREWLCGQKSACERALDYLLRRDTDGNGLVEMMTDSHTQQKGSDWLDIIWASYKNALVNAELYGALTLWAEAEEVLGDRARALEYRRCAARLKTSFNWTTDEGGFWDRQNQWYVHWRDKDGSVHGNCLVTPVNLAAIGYGLCDDGARRDAILRRMEEEMQKAKLFFWPLTFFPYQAGEGHANNFPFPSYENGDIFLAWGELAVRAYARSNPEIAVKYVRNVLDKYDQDGLSCQRYERKSQRGAGEDILANNCMAVVGLYRDIYGVQPKYNRLYLEPHLTPELSGTRLRYQLRGQCYVIDLDMSGSRVAVEGFGVSATEPFAVNAKGDLAEYFPGNQSTPALSVARSRREPAEIQVESWPASATGARRWTESALDGGVRVKHVVAGLRPESICELRCDGRRIGSFKANAAGRVEFARTLHSRRPQRLELSM
jgi:hypothetical protein